MVKMSIETKEPALAGRREGDTMGSAEKAFGNAKACFAENLHRLPKPGPTMSHEQAILWNISRGLHDLTVALEGRIDDLERKIAQLQRSSQ
jgi:hypothetical protein